jgi:HSP20 family protein
MPVMQTMGLAPVLPPSACVNEFRDEYVVHLTVPGFAREELEVEIADHVVTVRGDQTEAGLETLPFWLHERLEERFELPEDVDTARVTASFAHGQVELHAPRTNGAVSPPRRVPIVARFAVNADASGV